MNTNPSAKRILCYGDSMTWGYIPNTTHERYPVNMRWTGVLQKELGESFEIIEEGLNSRTLNSDDPRPRKQGRNGMIYLLSCLNSHDPIDLVVLMLGTNELKDRFDTSSTQIAKTIEEYIKLITTPREYTPKHVTKVLLISPPILNLEIEYAREKYALSKEKNLSLAKDYQMIAQKHGCMFLNSAEIITVGADGVHFNAENHEKLGEKIASIIKNDI